MKFKNSFHTRLIKWQKKYGRSNLPWQRKKTPYRVWVSEIMLQQTQVATVIPYFERFIERFGTLEILARAKEDEVFHYWSGLGFYNRARNLKKAAELIVTHHQGKIPNDFDQLKKLPGIGRSTAGAILAIAFEKPYPILDGNVKRVLSRFYGIMEPIDDLCVESKLWQLAEKLTPKKETALYTQAIMDLGATLCIKGTPICEDCPLSADCKARSLGVAAILPKKKKRMPLKTRSTTFIILKKGNRILLEKRKDKGVWSGLWGFPEMKGVSVAENIETFCRAHLNIDTESQTNLAAFRHTFSHFHLDIYPVIVTLKKNSKEIVASAKRIWYNPLNSKPLGLPKPVQFLLNKILTIHGVS